MTPALYDTLDALSDAIEEMRGFTADYADKMMHALPKARSVDRVQWLVERLAGKTCVHVGCAGPLHGVLAKVCTRLYGLDREPWPAPDCHVLDLDRLTGPLPVFDGVEIVACLEILEHLGNPRFLLESLREAYPTQQLVVTGPNGFSVAAQNWLRRGYEQVNAEHVWWGSWHTTKVLIEMAGYKVQEFLWYNGQGATSEGLVFVAQPQGDG